MRQGSGQRGERGERGGEGEGAEKGEKSGAGRRVAQESNWIPSHNPPAPPAPAPAAETHRAPRYFLGSMRPLMSSSSASVFSPGYSSPLISHVGYPGTFASVHSLRCVSTASFPHSM